MKRTGFQAAATSIVACLIGFGCGDTPGVDSSLNEATVTGTVLIKGVPATGGEILFNPSNVERKVATKTATIGKDGTYSIKTYTGDNLVSLRGEVVERNHELGLWKQGVVVAAGENNVGFDLLSGKDEGPKRRITGIPQGASPDAALRRSR